MIAAQLRSYLSNPLTVVHARLVSASTEGDAEIIDLEVNVDLPQRPIYRINKTERIRVRFPVGDAMPQVFALRKNFPSVPHTIINEASYPRQLCLYERSWADERPNWAPRPFVERIRRWMAGTADGTLHRPDQPLEAIMQHSHARIALPWIPFVGGRSCRMERFFIIQRAHLFWVAHREKPTWASADLLPLPVLIVQGPPVLHGIMHKLPLTLGSLEELLLNLGGSLVKAISAEIGRIRDELKGLSKQPLLIVVELPKQREQGGEIESIEHRAFFVASEIGELFKIEEVQVQKNGIWVPQKRELFEDAERLKDVSLMPLSVRWHLSADSAALMNGYKPSNIKVLAIGAGSLGSQVANNLWRGGFGDWTLVDNDDLEAHNPARHLLTSGVVGHNKAAAVSAMMQQVFPDRAAPAWIPCDYLTSDDDEGKMAAAMGAAELIFDLSASVNVERRLAKDARGSARRMTAFMNQRGDESVLLVEDAERKTDLFWLESEYMRAVAFDDNMLGHFDNVEAVGHRYGNGCRDISATVAQDGVALHAGLLSHRIRQLSSKAGAAVVISRWSRNTGAVSVVNVAVTAPIMIKIADWLVLIHPAVMHALTEHRAKSLPNETGGILVGILDRTQRSLAVIGMMPAPSDSHVWPTSFIRGSNGLAAAISKTTKRTLGNVIYVGEWHSHPDGYCATPSVPDIAAVAICTTNTHAEGLPTLMLIVADKEIRIVMKPIDRDEITVMLIA